MRAKKIFLLFVFLMLNLSESNAQKPFVLVLYNIASPAIVDVYINKILVTNIEHGEQVWHTIYSNGSLHLTVHGYSGAIGRTQIDSHPNDTVYVKILEYTESSHNISAHDVVRIRKVTRDQMELDLEKYSRQKYARDIISKKSNEDPANPYVAGTIVNTVVPPAKSPYVTEKSGTGFLLSHQGYIVTAYSLVEGAKEITVRGVNGDLKNSSPATITVYDKENNIALLKLKEGIKLDSVPYVVQTLMSAVTEKNYSLSYPVQTTNSEEYTLREGTINTQAGTDGNINAYDIGMSTMAGSSGAPLFDSKGNIIGMINAKNINEGNNNSYAIKGRYIHILSAYVPAGVFMNNKSKVPGKTFLEQIAELKKFVYLIEVK